MEVLLGNFMNPSLQFLEKTFISPTYNTLNYHCDNIPNDLKKFIEENRNSLKKTISGYFIKSLWCENYPRMVHLWSYKFTFDVDGDSNESIANVEPRKEETEQTQDENPVMIENNDGEIPTQPQPTEPEDMIETTEDSKEVNSGAQSLIYDILLIITCLMHFVTIHFCTSKLI